MAQRLRNRKSNNLMQKCIFYGKLLHVYGGAWLFLSSLLVSNAEGTRVLAYFIAHVRLDCLFHIAMGAMLLKNVGGQLGVKPIESSG